MSFLCDNKNSGSFPFRFILHKLCVCLLVFSILNMPLWALNWDSGTNASFNGTDTVTVDALRSIGIWNDFNTAPGQLIQFLQSGGAALTSNHAVLNKVIGANPTLFEGILQGGQGHIILFNPNGITVGSTAQINAGRFTASTMPLMMTDQEFLDGNSTFKFMKQAGDPGAQIALLANSEINAKRVDLLAQQISNAGTIMTGSDSGTIVAMAAGDYVYLGESGSNVIVEMSAPDTVNNWTYNVINESSGKVSAPNGTIVMAAGDTFAQALAGVQNQTYPANTFTASQRGTLESQTLEIGAAHQADIRNDAATLANEIKIAAQKVLIEETLESGSKMTLDSDYDITAFKGLKSGDDMTLSAGRSVQVQEDIISQARARIKTAITHAEGVLSAQGDIISEEELLLEAESVLWGDSHQTISSNTSSVKSAGSVSKITPGNLYISAETDVQLDDSVSAVEGGVSVIAETGKIQSNGTDTLNIAISGYSDEITDSIGVELPDGDGKAAIVLNSQETLNLGPDAALTARGYYQSEEDGGTIDNRPDIEFLKDDGTVIGGWERDEGIASDVAIYVGSETSNVNVATTQIEVEDSSGGKLGPATVVFDARDTVTMPSVESIEQSQRKNENLFKFRLEVVTRITEWLFQAVQGNKLPYAGNPEAVENVTGQDYVLRGAGLDNPIIKTEQEDNLRIWVLEDPPPPQPRPQPTPVAPVAPLAQYETPEFVGCPAELEAAAYELGINSDELQLKIQNSMAANPNLQPCDACARLVVAAGALMDRDGERYAAMVEIFNSLAPIDAPFTPEVSATITSAFSELANEDPSYALANDFIDSFVAYIAVLEQDLKTPIGDAVVFTLNKYGENVMSNPNQNIVSYLVDQLPDRG